jgi:ech hydrogenase subunit D
MFEKQEIDWIEKGALIESIRRVFDEGYRLVQIGCTRDEMFQMDYTFDRKYKFLNLRVKVPVVDAAVPSISGVYSCAFTYENEIHDLFGIRFDGMNINYNGNFYRVGVKAPFNISKVPSDKA